MSWDRGLQPERTALAWRRTVLALVVGPLVALHLLPAVFGWWGVALGAAGLVAAGLVALASERRASGVRRALAAGGALPGAAAMALAAAAIAGAAAVCFALALLLPR